MKIVIAASVKLSLQKLFCRFRRCTGLSKFRRPT